MLLPAASSGIWIGIGIGILGISFWVVGILIFDRLVDRYRGESDDIPAETDH